MKSIIVGTAGHVDHGKTALVKALTGIDADRLAEEKRRGITIDLGFAHMELPGPCSETLRLGFVDVPGHERFVRNMLAGVGGIDLVLLVIAADESIMPQTREHFDILQLLGVQRGITVLTKADAVDAETLDVVRLEVEEFLRGTFLEAPQAPVVAVSSITGAGLSELKNAILKVAAQVEARDSAALVRLPVDRVFSMKGFGTVVTGTLISGAIHPEDELEIFPTGQRARVRGVQVHGQPASRAVAGQRTALNLAGVATEDLRRGMTLAPPATLETTKRVDVKLRLLADAPRAVKNRTRVHFHSYATEMIAEIGLPERKDPAQILAGQILPGQILAGQEAFARLKLSEAALLLPGDRFILRQFSPVITIGGGVVLDATPIPRMPGLGSFLQTMSSGAPEEILRVRIARRSGKGISRARLVAETGWTTSFIEAQLAARVAEGSVVTVGDLYLERAEMQALSARALTVVQNFHQKNPLVGGIGKEELRVQTGIVPEIFEVVVSALVGEKKLEIAGDLIRLPGRGVVMKDEEAESKKKIEDAFAAAGLKVPALNEVLAGLKVDKVRAQKIVTLLLRDKSLTKISDDLVFHRTALEQLRREIAAYKLKATKIDVAKFKELTGVSRKYAIPLLEYLDRERVTRRLGDVREIL
jgi:selenocysteine-specific elongation factor